MKNRIIYLQYAAALMVFIGIPLNARYRSLISYLLIFTGVILVFLLGYIKKKINKGWFVVKKKFYCYYLDWFL